MLGSRGFGGEIEGFFCPLLRPGLLKKRLASGKCIETNIGIELHCPRCKTYWPMDTEFWLSNRARKDGLYGWCRACWIAHRWPQSEDQEGATMKSLLLTVLLAASGAHAATTVTAAPGPWDLYKGTSKVGTFPSNAECIEGARVRTAALGVIGSFTYGCRTTTAVTVKVAADPVEPVAIVTQPLSATVLEGMPVLLVVSATGGVPLSYQWYKDGAAVGLGGGLIPSGPTYGLTFAALTDAGTYTVSVRNSVGSVMSQPAIVVVQPKQPPPPPPGGAALLSWSAPVWKADGTTPADVAGYLIRYGQQSDQYTASMSAAAPPATVPGLAAGTWYFAVSTIDADGNESPASYELSKTINP